MNNQEASRIFGERVRRKRLMCGFSQRVLAQRLGTPAPHISKLEGGQYLSIEFGEIHQLIEVLRTSANYLLGLSNDPGEIPEKLVCALGV